MNRARSSGRARAAWAFAGVAPTTAGAIMACIAGCAGNGAGLDASGQPVTPGGGSSGPLTATFDSIQEHVFTPICTVCHIGAGAPHGLRLDAANSFNLLVGVPSDEVSSVLRVKPGDPDNSYLIQKLEGHAAVGARMPFGGPYLANDVIAVIRQWITDGAQASTAAAAATPAGFGVATVTPAAHELLPAAPPQIMIGMNRALDVTRVGPQSARLERLATDPMGGGELAQPVPARVQVPRENSQVLLLWPERPLASGRYRVIVDASAASGLSDIAGNPPSGPAAPGTSLEVTSFDVGGTP